MLQPLISDYKQAVLDAANSFKDLLPIEAEAVQVNGEPKFATGNFAVVFQMRKKDSNKLMAVKCFHRHLSDRQVRQQHIAAYLEKNKPKYFVPYRYLPEELWIDTGNHAQDYAVVAMDWVEGKTLGETVKNYCKAQNKEALSQLTDKFCEMAAYLLAQPIAHGDLKHDNILVTPAGELVLVDYDGMYVPALQGHEAAELGGTDYQHPQRKGTDYNATIDDYSIAIIALSLAVLAQQPELYELQKGENLLLSRQDILNPFASEILPKIEDIDNKAVQKLLNLVKNAVMGQSIEVKGLNEVLENVSIIIVKAQYKDLTLCSLPSDFFEKETTKIIKEIDSVYIGEISNHKKHGKGIYKFSNGDIYEGDWIDGNKTGKGIYKWVSGNIYEGDWIDDRITGKGIFKWFDGDIYEGDFIDGKKTGKGVLKCSDGDTYNGDFVDDERTGKGIYKWANGDIYEGDFIIGKKTGKGVYKWIDGDIYEGDFIIGKKTGKGVYKWIDGDIYEGDFVDGKKMGKGIYKWVNGNIYEGNWVNNTRTGKGIIRLANGNIYEGEWMNDKKVGRGISKFVNGDIYEGNYVDGEIVGKGIFTKTDGRVYEY